MYLPKEYDAKKRREQIAEYNLFAPVKKNNKFGTSN
jgi:hypothetical protein